MTMLDTVKSLFKQSRSLQVNLVVGVVALMIITSTVIISYNYVNHRRNILNLSEQMIQVINGKIVEQTVSYLRPALEISEITADHISNGTISPTDFKAMEIYMMSLIVKFKHIPMIYFSDPQGNFIMLRRMEDTSITTKKVLNEDQFKTTYWTYRDLNGEVIKKEGPYISKYNARLRPWFIGAQSSDGVYLSDVYTFFSDKQKGLTSSISTYNKNGEFAGVFGIDFYLKSLTTFLDDLRFKESSFTYILDEKGQVVSKPSDSTEDLEKSHLNVIQTRIQETSDLDKVSVVHLAAKPHLILVTDFPEQYNKSWKIAFIVPTQVILEDINKSNLLTIFISFLILILAIYITKHLTLSITNPILELTKEADRIKQFNIGKSKVIETQTEEINQMANTFESMKTSLRSFQKYVPKNLVRDLVQSGEQAKLGGKNQSLSVMFTDVVGFTTLSEGVSPEELTSNLSDYLEQVTKVIRLNKGTIDKYIGDAVMAFWGAPRNLRNNALYACKAAIDCKNKIEEMNQKWEAEGRMVFPTRIGVNSGSCIVGNIGSAERLNYTVLGDNVNLASRLEGINKLYGTTIIISEYTYEKVADFVEVRPLDLVAVKGKTEGIYIYELLSMRQKNSEVSTLKQSTFNKKFSEALFCYLQKKWDKSLSLFEELYSENPEDKATTLYIKRCRTLIQNPPSDDWNGIVQITEK